MEYLTTSTGRFLNKIQDKSRLQEVSLRFFRQAMYKGERERLELLAELREKLEELTADPFERRGFVYLDIFRWIDSKLKQQPIKSLALSH